MIDCHDGGHTARQQLASFRRFPRGKESGLYLVEDVCASFWRSHLDLAGGASFLCYGDEPRGKVIVVAQRNPSKTKNRRTEVNQTSPVAR